MKKKQHSELKKITDFKEVTLKDDKVTDILLSFDSIHGDVPVSTGVWKPDKRAEVASLR